jgi:hypothetical protein
MSLQLARQVCDLAANAQQYRAILARVDDPSRRVFRDLGWMLRRDHGSAENLVAKLKRAHEKADGDLLLRLELAEQLRAATAAAAQLESMLGRQAVRS